MELKPVLVTCLVFFLLSSCKEGSKERQLSSVFTDAEQTDSATQDYDLYEIEESGELICITISGPDTYFEFRGKGFGLQNDLAELYSRHIGVRLRMEVAHDTAEVISRLRKHEADIAAIQLNPAPGTLRCINGWLVNKESTQLHQSINEWYKPEFVTLVQKRTSSPAPVRRTPRPVMLDASAGRICQYDVLLQRHASSIGWDWRLLAAQCYQESAFDPHAVSWAGAQGLMQIMPATAVHLGVKGDIFDPETNIEASVRYLQQLNLTFNDIPGQVARIPYILAAYNGGVNHVRDAMALTRKHGLDDHQWRNVEDFILKLSQPLYYRDPVVTSGYLRGTETHGYVRSIMERWAQYRGQARNYSKASTPAPSKRSKNPTQIRRPDFYPSDPL